MADHPDQADFDTMGQWLLSNQDKAGSPEFTEMARAYDTLKSRVQAPPPQQGGADPNSFRNVVGRITSNTVAGIPDTLITGHNTGMLDWASPATALVSAGKAALNYFGAPTGPERAQLPLVAPALRKEWNVAELPADASTAQYIAEGAGAAAPYALLAPAAAVPTTLRAAGGAGINFLRNTVLPAATGHYGSEIGGAIGGEKGAFIGGLLGSTVPSMPNPVRQQYIGRGAPNAPQIMAAADRLGITPTAGQLGDAGVKLQEKQYVGKSPGGFTDLRQQQARADMTNTAEGAAIARGGTGAGVAATGEDIAQAASDAVAREQGRSSAGQQVLLDRIGPDTQVPVNQIILETLQQIPTQSVPGRDSLNFRIRQLYPLINRDASGAPVLNAQGELTVPYGLLKQWRTDLGRSFEQGRYPPATTQMYDPATRSMEAGATGAGVPVQDFRNVQARTRAVEGPGGTVETLNPLTSGEPQRAYNYLLEGGQQNPGRLENFDAATMGDPRQSRVYGNYLQQIIRDTLGRGGRGAAQGPVNFANTVDTMSPRSLSTLAGPQEGVLRDVSTLARATDIPTGQAGMTRAMGGLLNSSGGRFGLAELLGQAAGAVKPGLGVVGRGVGYFASPVVRAINERVLQSAPARQGLTTPRGAGETAPMTIQDLVAAMAARQAAQGGQ